MIMLLVNIKGLIESNTCSKSSKACNGSTLAYVNYQEQGMNCNKLSIIVYDSS